MELVRTAQDVADVVRAARAARGWTQQRAADAAGVSRRFVSMVEGGHAAAEMGRVLALLDALEVRMTIARPTVHAATAEATSPGDAAGPDEIDLDAYLSTFRTAPVPR
jgi:y4mF family transcriptional regulator